MMHNDADVPKREAIVHEHVSPPSARFVRMHPQGGRWIVPWHGHTLPYLVWTEIAEDAGSAADVIGIAVANRHVIEPSDAERPERGRDNATADVEAGTRNASSIDAQRSAIGKLHDRGITLPDVEKCHTQRRRRRSAVRQYDRR